MASQAILTKLITYSLAFLSWSPLVRSANFPWEKDILTDLDPARFPAIRFGDATRYKDGQTTAQPGCKVGPGDTAWPAESEWARLNSSLSGALLKPVPAAAVCYSGKYHDTAKCNFLLREASRTRFYSDDPLTVLTEWPEGNTCVATSRPVGNCTQGGFPVYVVNATTVKHIQLAVNFARNKNLRLVIK